MNQLKRVMFRIGIDDWELFKKITREQGKNASVEIRCYIKKYIEKYNKGVKNV